MARDDEDENESTSLLPSSSTPPPPAPYPDGGGGNGSGSNRPSLSGAALHDIEQSARRLAGRENDDGNVLPDSDSVNGLLASDDDASVGSIGRLGAADENNAPVTVGDLEFLAGKKKDAQVDAIGNELLGAADNPELEQSILRRSLAPSRADGGGEGEGDGSAEAGGGQRESRRDMLSERVHESTRALRASVGVGLRKSLNHGGAPPPPRKKHAEIEPSAAAEEEEEQEHAPPSLKLQILSLASLTLLVMLLLFLALALGTLAVGPPRQPLGEYRILEAQVGNDFWQYYDFYAGKDSAGSNGYIDYVSRDKAFEAGIAEVITEEVPEESMIQVFDEGDPRWEENLLAEDHAFLDQLKRKKAMEERGQEEDEEAEDGGEEKDGSSRNLLPNAASTDDLPPPKLEPFNPNPLPPDATNATTPTETFVLLSSSPTEGGPRDSLRLEGRRRFNRGLFIIDLRHMPAGCGTWPAFWLTDEANWPVNGEIDIVEGVNYQDTAKTALHATKVCTMDDVPEGSKTGSWDTAVGIPNRKTGIPDMTFRYAQNCFVYDPHQWLNQGCVATDLKTEGRSLGMPFNANGGGVYALEWDPINRHIRSWVFSPHGSVPRNLREALRTATEKEEDKRVAPDTNQWGLPYGHFPIGEGTDCPSGHFRNMRLVINLAFCGSVSGNRYFMDCPKQFKEFKTCNEYVASNPEELKEAYWKIRGVYVYERAWQRQWT